MTTSNMHSPTRTLADLDTNELEAVKALVVLLHNKGRPSLQDLTADQNNNGHIEPATTPDIDEETRRREGRAKAALEELEVAEAARILLDMDKLTRSYRPKNGSRASTTDGRA